MSNISAQDRRRRADSQRSRSAILDAAISLFGSDPQAGLAQVATAAGVTRQTVYAHFSSRSVLNAAVLQVLTDAGVAELDRIDLDSLPPLDALQAVVETGRRMFERYPILMSADSTALSAADDDALHETIAERLERLIARGQHDGTIDPDQSPDWLIAATIALGHAAAMSAHRRQLSDEDATASLRTSLIRLFRAPVP